LETVQKEEGPTRYMIIVKATKHSESGALPEETQRRAAFGQGAALKKPQ